MEQITVYKAFDGEQFDTAKECLEHEQNSLPQYDAMMNLLLFDKDTILIPFTPGITYSYLYNNVLFFIIVNKTEESLACLRNILAQGPYDCPDPIEEGHVYTWSNRDGWYDYSEKFYQMKETVDIIVNAMIKFRKELTSQNKEST